VQQSCAGREYYRSCVHVMTVGGGTIKGMWEKNGMSLQNLFNILPLTLIFYDCMRNTSVSQEKINEVDRKLYSFFLQQLVEHHLQFYGSGRAIVRK